MPEPKPKQLLFARLRRKRAVWHHAHVIARGGRCLKLKIDCPAVVGWDEQEVTIRTDRPTENLCSRCMTKGE